MEVDTGRGAAPNGRARRPEVLTGPVVLLLLAGFGGLSSFYLLLSVVPLYAVAGGAGDLGAGLTTGALMVSTVATELVMTRLLARLGYRLTMGLGLLLLGAPAFLLLLSSALPLIVAVCLVRGAGLAIVAVTGSALIAELVRQERRGEGLGLYGVAVGVPAIVGLPLGVWLIPRVGYAPVFVAAAVVALAAVGAVAGLPAYRPAQASRDGVLAGLRTAELVRPSLVFLAVTLASGVVATFVPLAVPAESRRLVSLALLVQAVTATLARWAAGRFGDRRGNAGLLPPAVLAAAVGMAGLIWTANPLALVVGMALFGIGFGIAQNATLTLMFERAPSSRYGTVSTMWNLAYDAGIGIGAVGFGAVAELTGYSTAFALTSALVFAALGVVWLDRRREG
ncbi:MAG TPA: MFS transporter [Actinomycetota bacterium]|jgi:predicted MFS family arabinose efflux permease|nr:MFS transporter [Actinomycetota bacterium]